MNNGTPREEISAIPCIRIIFERQILRPTIPDERLRKIRNPGAVEHLEPHMDVRTEPAGIREGPAFLHEAALPHDRGEAHGRRTEKHACELNPPAAARYRHRRRVAEPIVVQALTRRSDLHAVARHPSSGRRASAPQLWLPGCPVASGRLGGALSHSDHGRLHSAVPIAGHSQIAVVAEKPNPRVSIQKSQRHCRRSSRHRR